MKMFLKYLLLFLVFMGLQIPLSMTESMVRERTHYREEAFDAVAQMQGDEQMLISPIVTLPYESQYWEESRDRDGNVQRLRKKSQGELSFTPSNLSVVQTQKVETREKGIYHVPIYTTAITIKGQFDFSRDYDALVTEEKEIHYGTPSLSLPMSQQTGIKSLADLKWANASYTFKPGSRVQVKSGRGVHTFLPVLRKGMIEFELNVEVRGTRGLSFLPIADKADVSIYSNWPHAQFIGAQLPDERQLNSTGFSARWLTHSLANNLPNMWQQCDRDGNCDGLLAQAFGVQLIDPVDIYVSTERAVKYGFLFLAVTFAAFVLYEVLYQLKIHPIQYGLVGLALTVFFMLLLSLAEQIGFDGAYAIAAAACIALLSSYMKSALQSTARLSAFVAITAMLYGALYVILQLEDFALLAGTVFIFVLLAVAMWLTRHIDWYQVQSNLQNKDKTTAPMPLAATAQELVNDIRL